MYASKISEAKMKQGVTIEKESITIVEVNETSICNCKRKGRGGGRRRGRER